MAECAICGSKDFIFLFKAYNYLSPPLKDFYVERCLRCGQARIGPETTEGYAHPPISYKKTEKTDAWHFLHPRRLKIIKKFKKRGRVLDIGCGLGEFLLDMKEQGWEIFGNDVSSGACRYAKEEFGLDNIYNNDLLAINFPDKFFDLVTLWHVIEHIPRPVEALEKITKILKDDGVFIIESPDFESPQRKLFRGKWYGLGLPDHRNMFSPKAIEKVLKPAGLKIIKKDYLVNLRVNFISFKRSLLRAWRLEVVPGEKGDSETLFLKWLKKYKLIFVFEIFCFFISFLLALINCGTCFRVYCKKVSVAQKGYKSNLLANYFLIKKQRLP